MAVAFGEARAQAIVSMGQSFVEARLLPGEREPAGSRLAGLRLTMTPGWKTYWRSPGEAGIPPRLDWSQSDNVSSVEVLWPAPVVFESFGMKTIGYEDRVVFPVRIQPEDPNEPVSLVVEGQIGVCREVCVLEQFELSEEITPDQRPIGAKQIHRAVRTVPMSSEKAGLEVLSCRITGAGRDRTMTAELASDQLGDNPQVLVEGHENLWVQSTRVEHTGSTLRVGAELRTPKDVSWVDRSSVRMTVLANGFAVDIQGCIAS